MRVLHVGKYYPPAPGGMERMLQAICEGERPRIDSRVLVANDGPTTVHEDVNGVPVTRVASWTRVGTVAVSPAFPWWLRRQAGDLVVTHVPNPLGSLALGLQWPRPRSIVWFHSALVSHRWFYPAYRPLFLWALRTARRVVVSSPRLLEHSLDLQRLRDKCVVIPFGIDASRLAATDTTEARVAALRAQYPGALILFVGRLVPYKGLDVLLRALPGLDATAVLVGDGPLRPSLSRLAQTLGVGGRVVFAGELVDDEMRVFYHACDVFVLPSVSPTEAFGVVQLEAMACGKPVVSTDLMSGVPWVNLDGDTGLVVPPGDVAALHAALARLLDEPTMQAKMGAQGRRRVMEEFTIAKMIHRTAAMYDAVVAERP